jgi:hypothetical protein
MLLQLTEINSAQIGFGESNSMYGVSWKKTDVNIVIESNSVTVIDCTLRWK